MSDSRHFKKSLSAFDLALIGFGTVFGSGWLFASSNVASIAGPAGIFSWLIAGIAVLALGIVYCELGAAIPSPGGAISYLDLSHGPMVTYLMGLMTVIYMSSIVGLEVVAARQYAAAWWPALNVAGTSNASTLGWFVQLGLIVFFFGLNFSSVRTFALANNIITTIKFVVPAIIVVTLLMHFKPANFHVAGFAPHGFSGIEAAVSTGGVIFAFLGLTPIVAVASEVRDPQRSIPIALVSSIIAAGVVYILLQVAFLGAVPTAMLSGGWESVGKKLALPFHDIAIQLGIAWLAVIVAIDAVVSPSGCGNIFFSATPRALYAWSNSGTFFKAFAKVDPKSGIPRRATWLTLALSVFWTLPFPSWEAMISVVSASLVVSYAVAPVSVAALRKSHPEMERPFRVKALGVVGPLAFVVATFIVYWTGWQNLCWLLGVQIALYAGYLIVMRKKTVGVMTFAQQIRSSLWVAGYYLLTLIASYLGPFGGIGLVPHPYDFLMVCAVALAVYHWGARTGAPREVKAHAEPSRYGKRSEENAYAEDLGECGV
ncbi:aspartate/glutamate:proton symporter (AGT family) [Paraburkholderia unamae]|uniref:APC family permease n=1 Tax=Paraburkholderia unamae TaxID=219649 RepID=UPI000DC45BDD|nr:APC family permease [Paraburkholderia unamae]RAR48225.1 aspartate/glutamate:proton symporter (AGT family) [Paraburkholderia unamae]